MRPSFVGACATSSGGGGSYTGPLDIVPGAVVAYSQRRMASAFSGHVIQINNGTTTQDFAADANNAVDPAAISAFIGGGAGTCAVWNDQSGNGADVIPTGPFASPVGPTWGASLFNGGPGLTSSRAVGELLGSSVDVTFANGQWTVFCVYILTDGTNESAPFGSNISGAQDSGGLDAFIADRFLAPDQRGWCIEAYDETGNTDTGGNTSLGSADSLVHIMDAAWEFGSRDLRLDGAIATFTHVNDAGGAPASWAARFAICGDTATATAGAFDGSLAEILVYDTLLSGANRLAIRQNIAAYYGITLS